MAYTHRTMCQVLEEVRMCYKTRNFAPVLGLIEEVQAMGNRMEAGLEGKTDYNHTREKVKELEAKESKLRDSILDLKDEIELLTGEIEEHNLDTIYTELYEGKEEPDLEAIYSEIY